MNQRASNQQPVPAGRPNTNAGSHAVARRKHGGGWLPWAILGLLALLALGIWALAKASDDDDDTTTGDSGVATSVASTLPGAEPSASGAPGAAPPATGAPGAAPTTGAGTPGVTALPGATIAPGTAGSLIANGQDVIAASGTPGGLAAYANAQAAGTARVESVVSDEGFWVGASPEQRVFVFLTPEARGSGGESPFQVVAGQTIEIVGSVKPLAAEVAANVTPEEGSEQLASQAFYVEATSVRLVG